MCRLSLVQATGKSEINPLCVCMRGKGGKVPKPVLPNAVSLPHV